jgi:hypothetical protein
MEQEILINGFKYRNVNWSASTTMPNVNSTCDTYITYVCKLDWKGGDENPQEKDNCRLWICQC